jgi:N-acetylmuramate 1-kinase
MTDPRLAQAARWLNSQRLPLAQLGWEVVPETLIPASSDASFRRYFRLQAHQKGDAAGSLILMDAPPEKEPIGPFVKTAEIFAAAGANVPQIIVSEPSQGFLLCSDLGDRTYLNALRQWAKDPDKATTLYSDAWKTLIRVQSNAQPQGLPRYDSEMLMREMRLFDEWYLPKQQDILLTAGEHEQLMSIYKLVNARCLAQPTVLVHRDYHSRNLMVLEHNNPGVLDFQDAVIGPITYDLVSLLRDAYIEWPEEIQIDWAVRYWQGARAATLPVPEDFGEFWRDFEWMGLQRHLKVLGIFARLYHRDGKENYLQDLPLVRRYALNVAKRYQGLGPLARLLERCA